LPFSARAQQPAGATLERLRKQGFVKVGIANAPPFSQLRPDGTMTGVAPTLAQRVLERLGIPKMEGAIATYGELIPGMLAGRWDFVAASMTITKERCAQVLYADPITFEGPCIITRPDLAEPRPLTIADLAKAPGPIGSLTGGAQYRELVARGVAMERISQFENELTMIDGLLAGRVRYLYVTRIWAADIIRKRQLKLDMTFPVADALTLGASNVFRMQDADFRAAYRKEQAVVRESGELLRIANQFGFEIPQSLAGATAESQCALTTAT
jgi:polar amino acid transport system substrate-binding protein